MRLAKGLVFLLTVLCFSVAAKSEEVKQTSQLEKEIAYLLKFVASSNCQFVRNGDTHSIEDALEHIQRKYDYYEDDIATAEEFIELTASKSTMSGKPYHVICDGTKQTSDSWLKEALIKYRNTEQ